MQILWRCRRLRVVDVKLPTDDGDGGVDGELRWSVHLNAQLSTVSENYTKQIKST